MVVWETLCNFAAVKELIYIYTNSKILQRVDVFFVFFNTFYLLVSNILLTHTHTHTHTHLTKHNSLPVCIRCTGILSNNRSSVFPFIQLVMSYSHDKKIRNIKCLLISCNTLIFCTYIVKFFYLRQSLLLVT